MICSLPSCRFGRTSLCVCWINCRVLEERVIARVGGIRQVPVDVRVIAATNRPLQEMIREGTFRTDLYYRLKVPSIQTQPVRDTLDEVVPFLQHYMQYLGGGIREFTPETARPKRMGRGYLISAGFP